MKLEHWIYKLPLRLRSLFHRSKVEAELGEEFQYHLERQIEALTAKGMSASEARSVALKAMHGIEQQKEKCREARGVSLIEDIFADVRYALRSFRKSPSVVAVILISLALGIGANTAIFSVINAVSLKMLPVREPEQLMLLGWHAKEWPQLFIDDMEGGNGHDKWDRVSSTVFPADVYAEIKKQARVFQQTVAFAGNDATVNVQVNGQADSAQGEAVSGDFFEGLGVSPILGRTILPSDDSPSAPPVAVVSQAFWRKHFGNDTDVAGKTININGMPVGIVGVVPGEFFGVRPGDPMDLYIPLAFYAREWTRLYPDDPLNVPKTWWLEIIGRLKPGANQASAQSEVQVIFDRALGSRLGSAKNVTFPTVRITPAARGLNDLRERFSTSLRLLMGMVGLVLLIACANVAGVLLSRATARQKEIAVRLSLGASRARVIRQLLTESLMLAVIGGSAGLLVSFWASTGLVHLLSTARNPIDVPAGIDARVLAFTAFISIVSGIFFGLVPAIVATKLNIAPTLKDNAMQFSSRSGRFRLGKILVGGQVALCLLLLIASGLLLRTLDTLQKVNLGFNRHSLLTFTVRPGLNTTDDQKLISYYQELQRRLQAVPGVISATLTQHGPIGEGYSENSPQIPGYTAPGQSAPDIYRHTVGPDYFKTLDIPIVMGRAIGEQDTASAPKALVVNEALVRKCFHGDNPIGRHLVYGKEPNLTTLEVVGVAKDVKYGNIRNDVPPTAYWSYQQSKFTSRDMEYMLRTVGDPESLANSVRQLCLNLDKDVPVTRMQTEDDTVNGSLYLERAFAVLSSAFGALALVLACVGLYGTVAYAVSRRAGEIGVRMALGAERGRILRMILAETFAIVVVGIVVGLPIAALTGKLLNHQLYGLSAHDPVTIARCSFAILMVSLLAGYIPARRAARVQPMVALRCE